MGRSLEFAGSNYALRKQCYEFVRHLFGYYRSLFVFPQLVLTLLFLFDLMCYCFVRVCVVSIRSAWAGRGIASVFRLVPQLLRAVGVINARVSAQARPVVSAAVQRLNMDSRVTELLGSGPYEVFPPTETEVCARLC